MKDFKFENMPAANWINHSSIIRYPQAFSIRENADGESDKSFINY